MLARDLWVKVGVRAGLVLVDFVDLAVAAVSIVAPAAVSMVALESLACAQGGGNVGMSARTHTYQHPCARAFVVDIPQYALLRKTKKHLQLS